MTLFCIVDAGLDVVILSNCNFLADQNLEFVFVSLISMVALLDSVWRDLSNGGFIVDFHLKLAFLDSPWAAESGKPIGILDGDREEAAGEFLFYRPF